MKKIISLLAATMMMFSFATISQAEGALTITGSNAAVNLNATDAVNVTFTFDFPNEVGLLGFQPAVAFDKTALKLNSYTLSGDVEWSTADSNANADYGAFLSFDDTNYVGTTPVEQYVLTLNFTVNDTTKAATYDITLNDLVGTDTDYMGLVDNYTFDVSTAKSTITVGETKPETKTFGAVVEMAAPGVFSALKGVEVTATNSDNVTGSVVKAKADIFGSLDSLTAATVELALNINNVPAGQALSNVTMAWAY